MDGGRKFSNFFEFYRGKATSKEIEEMIRMYDKDISGEVKF